MFQASDLKENQFLDLLDDDNNLSSHLMSKGNCGSKLLAIQTLYVCVLQELLQIMLLSANTDLGSSLERNLSILAVYTLLNQDVISFMSVVDLMVIGI